VPLQNSWIVLNHKINMLFNHHLILPAARHVRKPQRSYVSTWKLSTEMHGSYRRLVITICATHLASVSPMLITP
jgi:hypothetical protein